MIVKCEQCGKKYKIDSTKISGKTVRTKCRYCHNIIEIKKSRLSEGKDYSSEDLDSMAPPKKAAPDNIIQKNIPPIQQHFQTKKTISDPDPKRMSIGMKFFSVFLISVTIMIGLIVYIFLQSIPPLISMQADLRTLCIAHSTSTAVKHPILAHDYLRINQIAETNSKLPNIAYVSVTNKKGIIIAGIFGNLKQFSSDFILNVKKQGFPRELPLKNFIPQGKKESSKNISIGGQKIYDVAVLVGDTGATVHVGLFTKTVQSDVLGSMKPISVKLAIVFIIGIIVFFIAANIITRPLQALVYETDQASSGKIDRPIVVQGSREINAIACSLEKIRISLQSAPGQKKDKPIT